MAEGVLPGKRKQERVLLLGRETFDIREVAADAAPLAARTTGARQWLDVKVPADRQAVEYRVVDGALLSPAIAIHGNRHDLHAPWEPLTEENAQAVLDLWVDWAQTNPDRRARLPLHPGCPTQSGRFADERTFRWREKVSDDRDVRAAQLKERMERSALIDGVLWAPCDRPTWRVSWGWERDANNDGFGVIGIKAWDDMKRKLGMEYEVYVPFDDYEQAVAVAERMAEKRGYRVRLDETARADILRPDLLAEDQRPRLLLEAARTLVNQLSSKVAAEPTDIVRMYADLRDMLAEIGASPSGRLGAERYDDLLGLATRINDRWTESNGGKANYGKANAMRVFHERVGGIRGAEFVPGAVEVGAAELRAIGLMK
jgi:hypothetical protein